jgi:hypothetical protein
MGAKIRLSERNAKRIIDYFTPLYSRPLSRGSKSFSFPNESNFGEAKAMNKCGKSQKKFWVL